MSVSSSWSYIVELDSDIFVSSVFICYCGL